MKRPRPRVAFTLPELMVYIVVLLVFMSGVYAAFSLSLRCFYTASARSDVVYSARLAANMIDRMVATGAGTTLQTSLSPKAFMFLSAQPANLVFSTDSSGNLYYQKWVCFWLDSANLRLMESEQALSTPSTSIPSAPSFATMTGLPSRVVAQNVVDLTFPTSNSYKVKLQASAAVAAKADSAKLTGMAIVGHFTMRN